LWTLIKLARYKKGLKTPNTGYLLQIKKSAIEIKKKHCKRHTQNWLIYFRTYIWKKESVIIDDIDNGNATTSINILYYGLVVAFENTATVSWLK
jgi:hypothetical protein